MQFLMSSLLQSDTKDSEHPSWKEIFTEGFSGMKKTASLFQFFNFPKTKSWPTSTVDNKYEKTPNRWLELKDVVQSLNVLKSIS